MEEVGMKLAAGQAVIVGTVLVLAGLLKLSSRASLTVAESSALSLLTRQRSLLFALWRGLGMAELLIGSLVLGKPGQSWPIAAATGLLVFAAGYVSWSWHKAPDRPCGCFGALSDRPVSRLTITRAALLAWAAASAAFVQGQWTQALKEPWTASALLLEFAVIGYLSPEVRNLPARFSKGSIQPDCTTSRISCTETIAALKRSELWQRACEYVRSEEAAEHWREGCWRFFCYPAEYAGRPVTAIFAVGLDPSTPVYRAALVDETNREVLLQTS